MSLEMKKAQILELCHKLSNCLRNNHKHPNAETNCNLSDPSSHSSENVLISTCCCATSLEEIRLSIRSTEDNPLQNMIWSTPECFTPLISFHNYIYYNKSSLINENFPNLNSVDYVHSCSANSKTSKGTTKLNNLNSTSVTSANNETSSCTSLPGVTGILSECKLSRCCPCGIESNNSSCFVIRNEDLAKSWAMCLVNLIMANSSAVQVMCSRLGTDKLVTTVLHGPAHIAQVWCAALLSCLKEPTTLPFILSTCEVGGLVRRLCELYCLEGAHSCFARYCMELLLCRHMDTQSVWQCWRALPILQQLLVLTVLGELAKGGEHSQHLSPPVLSLLSRVFTAEAGRILSNDEQQLTDCDPQVVREACWALVLAAGQREYREFLQDQDQLLFVSICFLKALNKATFGSSDSAWVQRRLAAGAEVGVGLRCDLVQLIGNLVHTCKRNQMELRDGGGLEEVFFSCRRDDNNPVIQEAVIFALGCSLRDNPECADHLRRLVTTDGGDVNSPVLARLGLAPKQFVQIPTEK